VSALSAVEGPRCAQPVTVVFDRVDFYYTLTDQEGGRMGAFLFGIIIGIAGTLAFVIYDEGEYFLRLHHGVRRTMERYRQHTNEPIP
jgi:hypothetical protein